MSIYTPIAKEGETRRVLALRSPIDLEPIGELVCANREDVQAAVARARAAQPGWAAKSFAERAEYMNRALRCCSRGRTRSSTPWCAKPARRARTR